MIFEWLLSVMFRMLIVIAIIIAFFLYLPPSESKMLASYFFIPGTLCLLFPEELGSIKSLPRFPRSDGRFDNRRWNYRWRKINPTPQGLVRFFGGVLWIFAVGFLLLW